MSLRQLEAAVKRAHDERDAATQHTRKTAQRVSRVETAADDAAAGAAHEGGSRR